MKACERLSLKLPEFFAAPREEQILLMVYAQERDQEEADRTLGSLGGGRTTTTSRAKDKIKNMKFRKSRSGRGR